MFRPATEGWVTRDTCELIYLVPAKWSNDKIKAALFWIKIILVFTKKWTTFKNIEPQLFLPYLQFSHLLPLLYCWKKICKKSCFWYIQLKYLICYYTFWQSDLKSEFSISALSTWFSVVERKLHEWFDVAKNARTGRSVGPLLACPPDRALTSHLCLSSHLTSPTLHPSQYLLVAFL